MGLFTGSKKASGRSLYMEKVKPQLAEKDGNVHVVMINSFSKLIDQLFGVETQYTDQIGAIVDDLQQDGYEIVDIKFNSLKGQGVLGAKEGFHTLIMYK